MRDRLDGRAGFAFGCALASLLVFLDPAAGVFFGLLGTTFAGASIVATDGAPTARTRRVALLAGVISVAALTVGTLGVISIRQN
jgi:hypothetical protein